MGRTDRQFLSGNEAAVLGAIDAGATMMFGYPITPATEILEGWISKAEKSSRLQYLQTEDEIAAGFGVLGAVLAGHKSLTASAGPGHVLLQDPISMAENMRLPFVGIMMQRGGPSTGTVNFSQQEVNLAAFGGNGEGLRVVYSASTVAEMYDLVIKAFSTAWKYRFPTFVLGDGYLGKMRSTISLKEHLNPVVSKPILAEGAKPTHLRNCYSSEEVFGAYLRKNIDEWLEAAPKIAESESYMAREANEIIIAHGLVASAAKEAVAQLRRQRRRTGLFRPITLNPFDTVKLKKIARDAQRIIVIESARNQLAKIVKSELFGVSLPVYVISKPAEGFTPEEIVDAVRKIKE